MSEIETAQSQSRTRDWQTAPLSRALSAERGLIAGLAVGVALALGAARGMTSVLYQVSPTDPVTFAIVTLTLALVAFIAAIIPARRATRVDPLVVLRYQ
jgi:ABC-type antimicrobial peptide transport system permease subunit